MVSCYSSPNGLKQIVMTKFLHMQSHIQSHIPKVIWFQTEMHY